MANTDPHFGSTPLDVYNSFFAKCPQLLQDEEKHTGYKKLISVDGERIILKFMLQLCLKICKFFLQNLK